jgi:hypothetical protein
LVGITGTNWYLGISYGPAYDLSFFNQEMAGAGQAALQQRPKICVFHAPFCLYVAACMPSFL